MRRIAVRLGVLAALAAGVMLNAGPAAAHASLIGSTPEDGAVLAESPDEVVLEFDEQLQPDFSQVAVLDAEENHYEDGDPDPAGSTVTQAVTELPAGDYRISYRVGSADGHPATGVVAFTVEPPQDEGTAGEPEPAASGSGSEDGTTDGGPEATDDAAGDVSAETAGPDEEGTPMATVAAAMAAVAVVGIAGVLLIRHRPGAAGDDSPPDGQ